MIPCKIVGSIVVKSPFKNECASYHCILNIKGNWKFKREDSSTCCLVSVLYHFTFCSSDIVIGDFISCEKRLKIETDANLKKLSII